MKRGEMLSPHDREILERVVRIADEGSRSDRASHMGLRELIRCDAPGGRISTGALSMEYGELTCWAHEGVTDESRR
jgi:hypothetical protein